MTTKASKRLAAAGVGLALMLGVGGGTFALWSDTDALTGGTITSGDLDITATGATSWADVSADMGKGASLPIADIADFLIVPGDTLERTQDVTVKLTGDNLKATLTLANLGNGAPGSLITNDGANSVKATNVVTDSTGKTVDASGVITLVSADYAAHTNTVPSGAVTVAADGTATLTVKTTLTFDSATPNQVLTKASADLGTASLTLQQVRP